MGSFRNMMIFFVQDIVDNLKYKLDNTGIRPNNDTFRLRRSLKKTVSVDTGVVTGNYYAEFLQNRYNYIEDGFYKALNENSEEMLESSWEEIVKSIEK